MTALAKEVVFENDVLSLAFTPYARQPHDPIARITKDGEDRPATGLAYGSLRNRDFHLR